MNKKLIALVLSLGLILSLSLAGCKHTDSVPGETAATTGETVARPDNAPDGPGKMTGGPDSMEGGPGSIEGGPEGMGGGPGGMDGGPGGMDGGPGGMMGGPGGMMMEAPKSTLTTQTVSYDGAETRIEGYTIGGFNYLRLSDTACALKDTPFAFDVSISSADKTVSIRTGETYTATGEEFAAPSEDKEASLKESSWKFLVNGTEAEIDAYEIEGYPFCKLADLAKYIGFSIEYRSAESTILITAEPVSYSLNAADYGDKWEHQTRVERIDKGAATGEYLDVDCYTLSNVVYCANPADPSVEVMNIMVPGEYMKELADGTIVLDTETVFTGTTQDGQTYTYTAETAPILFLNTVDAYKAGGTATVGAGIKATTGFYYATYLERGIIVVTPGCRGRDSDLELNGFAPAGLADLKAAVRYLKYNDSILPGNSDRIISVGGSAGGGMSALLGSTGNSPDYADALKAIGAADATDDIYAAICYCPITDLDYADGGYEWIHYAEKTGYSDFELALQDAFYYGYIDYVQSFDLDRELGSDGRSGDYYTDFLEAWESGLAYYLSQQFSSQAQIEEYLAQYDPDNTGYITYDASNGSVSIRSFDDFATNYSSFARMKGVPSFDSLERTTNENAVFSTADGEAKHFSTFVANALEILSKDYPEAAEYNKAYESDLTDEILRRVSIMNPVNYIVGENQGDVAGYWRLASGSKDGDLSSSSAWLLANLLESYCDADVTFQITWEKPHGTAEYTMYDQMDWIVSVTALAE